jgi:2,4-dienoyl-CoA reductase-like NADH-dependent reductase (Old Yellow Enzyme family)
MATTRYPGKKADPSPLAQPLKFEFSGLTAKNRFLKSSMTEQQSSWDVKAHEKRGVPSDQLVNVYRRWGEGDYGVILSGNIMLFYDELESSGNAIMPMDAPFSGERFEQFKKMATAAKAHGSLFIAQLSHPGRQVVDRINDHPISASDVQLEGTILGSTYAKPRPMEEKDFKLVIDSFVHAAEYSYKAGFDGVQLHAAQ